MKICIYVRTSRFIVWQSEDKNAKKQAVPSNQLVILIESQRVLFPTNPRIKNEVQLERMTDADFFLQMDNSCEIIASNNWKHDFKYSFLIKPRASFVYSHERRGGW